MDEQQQNSQQQNGLLARGMAAGGKAVARLLRWILSLLVSWFGVRLTCGLILISLMAVFFGAVLSNDDGGSSDNFIVVAGEWNMTSQGYDQAKFEAAWKKYFSRGVLANSLGDTVSTAKKYQVSPALIAAIMGNESGWGTSRAIREKNNPSGQMRGSTILPFSSLSAGIDATGKTLHNLIYKNGLTTLDRLGSAYAPVGASNDPNNMNAGWIPTVRGFLTTFGFLNTVSAGGGGGGSGKMPSIAATQLGNTGGDKFWSYMGFSSHVEWCACFVSWVAHQAGMENQIPHTASTVVGVAWFKKHNEWHAPDGYTPKSGDIIYYDWTGTRSGAMHVGIVESADASKVYTIEGNTSNMVARKVRARSSRDILGYGSPR